MILHNKCINAEWFLREIGPFTLVPLCQKSSRQQPNQKHSSDGNGDDAYGGEGDELDEDGRAVECETIDMQFFQRRTMTRTYTTKSGEAQLSRGHR